MGAYIIRRLIQIVPVIVLASIVIFGLMHMIPGDPALVYAGPDASPEQLAAIRTEMGLDQPLPTQYLVWAEHMVKLDFGRSYTNKYEVMELIRQRAPATLELALAAVVLQ